MIRGAAGYLTISEASKRDIVELLHIAPENVFVTPLGADKQRFKMNSADIGIRQALKRKTLEKLGLSPHSKLILYVGGIDPRKNVPFLLEAFAEFLATSRSKAVTLLIAGRYDKDDQYPKVRQLVAKLGLHDAVKFLGYVPDTELLELYSSSDLFAFPSLYEGFGLPVLEAMACGLPVMAANNSSIPEVVGPEYPLFEDNNKQAWVRGLTELIDDRDRLISMSQLGVERAKKFSWERTVELTVEAYQTIGKRVLQTNQRTE